MIKAVLDSSAVLAYMKHENGAAKVLTFLGNAVISTVNVSEVFSSLLCSGISPATSHEAFDGLYLTVADFTRHLAEDAGELILQTRPFGLSLGDRACLALARREGLPVLTADRAWKDLNIGVEIELIR